MSEDKKATQASLTVFAPAKINLYLHVTGRRDDGYHALDSLVSFADIGDQIILEPKTGDARDLSFEVRGPFAPALTGSAMSAAPDSMNLVIKAVWALSRLYDKLPSFHITLIKNLPLGAGLGGGSSDAAAVIWELLSYWGLPHEGEALDDLLLSLGADVPVCFSCNMQRVQGIGDILKPIEFLQDIPVVLVHPGKACSTAEIFGLYDGHYKEPVVIPKRFDSAGDLISFLGTTDNVLTTPAIRHAPDIQNVLNAMNAQNGCNFSRMSGSGSACFGLFEDEQSASVAAERIYAENPDWWVQTGWLGRPERY